jgi:NADH pyrophosphatase NudC (nudix superfamily)
MTDQPRFVARAAGYTSNAGHAVDLLEAVTEQQQQDITEAAHRRALDERIQSRQASAAEIGREIAHLESRLRFLGRQLRRLSRA